jgi:hypothetical protein
MGRSEDREVPWFTEPPPAKLEPGTEPEIQWLHFIDPQGHHAVVYVTTGQRMVDRRGENVWHIEVADEVATVSPSIHFLGYWHSPNPVTFRLVDSLSED